MGSQHFSLKWKNHQTNLLSVFDQLLQNEAFVDVTIACEGLSIKAHKIILSACSHYFQSLFIDNPCKHPIVILKDMKFSELKAILDFMYKGEVSVSQEQLPNLLKTAEALQVKGLAEVTGQTSNPEESVETSSCTKGRTSPPVRKKRKLSKFDNNKVTEGYDSDNTLDNANEGDSSPDENDWKEPVTVNQEQPTSLMTENESNNLEMDNSWNTGNNIQHLPNQFQRNTEDSSIKLDTDDSVSNHTVNIPETEWPPEYNVPPRPSDVRSESTPLPPDQVSATFPTDKRNSGTSSLVCCNRQFSSDSSLRRHIETHVRGGRTFICPICGQIFSRLDNMKRHIKKCHNTETYAQQVQKP